MRNLVLIVLISAAPSIYAQATLSPLTPTVLAGATQQFTVSGSVGTSPVWSCSGCLGSINQSGLYTAPASVTPNQTLGGYQLLPNDHIFNRSVAALSVHANSVHWMTDGIYDTNMNNAPAPSISCSNAGGSLATSAYFVKYTYKWAFGAGLPSGESKGSAEATCSVTAGSTGSITITAPIIPTNIQGYTVYDSTTTGTELQQAAANACVNITTNCTITTLGAGAAVPTTLSGNIGVLTFQPSVGINYLSSFPTNYLNVPGGAASSPITMSFFYTSANNGSFLTPTFPDALIETGWWDALTNHSASDHHLITIDANTGNVTERYQYYCALPTTGASVNGSNQATYTFATDPSTGPTGCGFYVGEAVCVGGFTVSDTYFNLCPMNGTAISAITPASITIPLTHGAGTASTNGSVTANTQSGGCSTAGTCNSQSGIQYNAFTYTLPSISTDAAGLQLEPLILRIQELEQAITNSGTINHALRVTMNNTFNCSCFVWPASTNASIGNFLPYGSRFRLRSSVNFPINGLSATAQILAKQLENYGLIMADGGLTWQINMESGPFSQAIKTAFGAIGSAKKNFTITNSALTNNLCTLTIGSNDLAPGYSIDVSSTANGGGACNGNNLTVVQETGTTVSYFASAANFGSASDSGTVAAHMIDYMDVIDESSLEETASSGATTSGEVVTYTSSTGSVSTNVALQGPSVNFAKDLVYVMAGTPAIQLPVISSNGGFTCNMSPAIGTLTSGCLFTAPATQASYATTTITATSTGNGSVSSQMTVGVCPQTGCLFTQSANYTDSFGRVWAGAWGNGANNIPQILGAQSVPDNNAPLSTTTDKQLWYNFLESSLTEGDYHSDFYVPSGSYQVTFYNDGTDAFGGSGVTRYYYLQSTRIQTVNKTTQAGAHSPFNVQAIAQVGSSNKLSFINLCTGQGQSNCSGDISSISIIPGAVARPSGSLP